MKKINYFLLLCFLIPLFTQAQVSSNEQKVKELLEKAKNAEAKDSCELALKYFKEAEALNAKCFDADAYYRMGKLYVCLWDNTQAINYYQKAISINQNFIDAYIKLGNSYRNISDYTQAISTYQKVLSINPNDTNAYYFIGVSYYRLWEYDQAISSFQKAISINPNFADAYCFMGYCYEKLKNYEKATSCFEKAADLGSLDAQYILEEEYWW
jgi:tetratricopeptide (TPR) repeat protein